MKAVKINTERLKACREKLGLSMNSAAILSQTHQYIFRMSTRTQVRNLQDSPSLRHHIHAKHKGSCRPTYTLYSDYDMYRSSLLPL